MKLTLKLIKKFPTGKEHCFQRVLKRFGTKCTYVVIGDNHEDEIPAKQVCLSI